MIMSELLDARADHTGAHGDTAAQHAALMEQLALDAEMRRLGVELEARPSVVIYHVPGRAVFRHHMVGTRNEVRAWFREELGEYMLRYRMCTVDALFAAGSPIRLAYAYIGDNSNVVVEGSWPELMQAAAAALSHYQMQLSRGDSETDDLQVFTF
jgi:hypothetical protein